MYSNFAIKIYALIKNGIIKSNADFWRNYYNAENFNSVNVDYAPFVKEIEELNIDLICAFDEDFPISDANLPLSEKPFFFVYKGNLNLIKDIKKNVAVVGLVNPPENVIMREEKIVKALIQGQRTIVSGLARGVDTVAHETCLACGGKTVAILPTPFDCVYPPENITLIEKIVNCNGLVLSEYITQPKDKYKRIQRFIERDRLQALYSQCVVLVAGCRKNEGDSGARHAMKKAKDYSRKRFVMLNRLEDVSAVFGLNIDEHNDGAVVLTNNSIKEIFSDDYR